MRKMRCKNPKCSASCLFCDGRGAVKKSQKWRMNRFEIKVTPYRRQYRQNRNYIVAVILAKIAQAMDFNPNKQAI